VDHDVDAIEGAWGHMKDQNQNEVSIAWITMSALLKLRGGMRRIKIKIRLEEWSFANLRIDLCDQFGEKQRSMMSSRLY
jgi:hypothetical protein